LNELTDQYFDLKALSNYSSFAVPTLREYLREDLPYYKKKGKIVVKRSDFDSWMEQFKVDRKQELDRIVEDAIKSVSH
jgi:hypothetical protein